MKFQNSGQFSFHFVLDWLMTSGRGQNAWETASRKEKATKWHTDLVFIHQFLIFFCLLLWRISLSGVRVENEIGLTELSLIHTTWLIFTFYANQHWFETGSEPTTTTVTHRHHEPMFTNNVTFLDEFELTESARLSRADRIWRRKIERGKSYTHAYLPWKQIDIDKIEIDKWLSETNILMESMTSASNRWSVKCHIYQWETSTLFESETVRTSQVNMMHSR